MSSSLWESFREELVATAMVMVVTVGGSFYLANRLLGDKNPAAPEPTKSPAHQVVEGMVQVLGQYETQDQAEAPTANQMPPSPSPYGPSPTGDPYITEVIYGVGGLFEYDSYRLEISNPRLIFDARTNENRKLVVDMTLINKTVTQGLNTNMTASVIKDGVVIVPAAALSVSQGKIVMPGESHSFQARIALIESTDIKELAYKPEGQPPTIHLLLP